MYLRKLFVQGARAVMQHRTKQSSGLSAWLGQLTARTHRNIAIVALAKNEVYRPPLVADTVQLEPNGSVLTVNMFYNFI